MPTGAMVVGTDPRRSKVTWAGISGRQETAVAHPYFGPTSWFRVNPERGTKIMIGYRGENLEPFISAYSTDDVSGKNASSLIDATEQGNFYYRVLREGEMQATSTGLADISWLASGDLTVRGGAVSSTYSNTDLELQHQAPTYRLMTLGSRTYSIKNEHRFGVATRSSPLDLTQKIAVKVDGVFAKENLRHLDMGGQVPLVDVREGIVIEDNGTPANVSGKNLRLRLKYGTTSNTYVQLIVDETGNTNLTIPQCDTGMSVKTTSCDFKLDVGKSWKITVTENINASAKKVKIDSNDVQIAGNKTLLTKDFQSTLNGANALTPPAAGPYADIASVTAIVTFLKTLPSGFSSALTVKTKAG